MTDSIRVRTASEADIATIAEFNRGIAMETEKATLDRNQAEVGVRKALQRPDLCRFFVAEIDGQLAGQAMITYEWSDWQAAIRWWIQSVYVHREYRGRGVFDAIYKHIEEEARQEGDVCGIRLYVKPNNHHAISVYERIGMKPLDRVIYEASLTGKGHA